MEENPSSFFDRLGAKASFYFGLGSGVGGLLVIGFFVLLSVNIKGGTLAFAGGNPSIAAAQPSAPSAAQPDPTSGNPSGVALTSKEWVRGNKDAKVSIVEFSDTECPFCKRFHSTLEQVVKDYNGKVNWVYRYFPLSQLHSYAPKEAEALACAGEMGGNDKFWAYMDRVMELTQSNDGLPPQQLPEIASYVGLDKTKFTSCLSSGKHTQEVNDAVSAAVAAGGTGTPYSVVLAGNQKIPINGAVPIEQLKSILDPLVK